MHHVDLGLGYEITDWPEEYVALELPAALAGLSRRLPDADAQRRLLAWLVGRADGPGRLVLDAWES